MITTRLFAATAAAAALGFSAAAQDVSALQEQNGAAQREVRLAICAFGTAETMTPIEEWLGKTIHPGQYAAGLPSLPQLGENKEHNSGSVKVEWSTAKLEVTHETDMIQAENQRNRQLLNEIRLKVLNDPSRRYVPLAGDYLEAALFERSRGAISLVALERADAGTRLVTVSLGDREEGSKVVDVNGSGAQAGVKTFRQPYVCKVRDLSGNTLLAFNGVGECSETANSVVSTSTADPQRRLIEDVCRQVAARIFAACCGELGVRRPAEPPAQVVPAPAQVVPAPARRAGKVKWLVLDKMTYQAGVDRTVFDGIDKLLLTKLVQAKKYRCLDRDMYNTAAREEGFGGRADLIPAGYAMSGEVVQLLKSGRSRTIGGTVMSEYIATVSIRANDLRTQQPYEAETLRVSSYCQTPQDMLVHVVKRTALAILMRDYPMHVMDADEDDGSLTLSYGADFLEVGEQYEVRRRRAIVDDDTGEEVYKEKTVGVCEVTDVGKNTSEAKLVSGKAKRKDVLRFYDGGDEPPPPMVAPAPTGEITAKPPRGGAFPAKKPRIAVAPFITKSKTFSVWGNTIEARSWIDTLVDHMSIQLAQCGSFRTLDRSFGPEIDRELDRIVSDPNANPKDVCRLSRKLATDYLVVAEVMFSNVASPGTDYVTGLPLPPPSAQFAEIRFRCVHAPTTEIVSTDVVRVDSKSFYGTPEIFTSGSSEWAAANVAAIIQSRLDPNGYARRQAELRAAAEAAAATQPAPQPAAPAPTQGINLGF